MHRILNRWWMRLTFMKFFTSGAFTTHLRESPIRRGRREDRESRRPSWVSIGLLTEKTPWGPRKSSSVLVSIGLLTEKTTDVGGDAVRTETVVVHAGFDRSSDGEDERSRRRRHEDWDNRRSCWFRSVFWRRRRQTPEETPWGESSSFVVSRRFDRLLGGEDEKPRQKKKNKETKKEKKF